MRLGLTYMTWGQIWMIPSVYFIYMQETWLGFLCGVWGIIWLISGLVFVIKYDRPSHG